MPQFANRQSGLDSRCHRALHDAQEARPTENTQTILGMEPMAGIERPARLLISDASPLLSSRSQQSQ
jgi:hypothetical protein